MSTKSAEFWANELIKNEGCYRPSQIDRLSEVAAIVSRAYLEAIKQITHMDRKAQHGCTDAHCPLCDGERT